MGAFHRVQAKKGDYFGPEKYKSRCHIETTIDYGQNSIDLGFAYPAPEVSYPRATLELRTLLQGKHLDLFLGLEPTLHLSTIG